MMLKDKIRKFDRFCDVISFIHAGLFMFILFVDIESRCFSCRTPCCT